MSVTISCPNCHAEQKFEESKIPPNVKSAPCHKCGRRFPLAIPDDDQVIDLTELVPDPKVEIIQDCVPKTERKNGPHVRKPSVIFRIRIQSVKRVPFSLRGNMSKGPSLNASGRFG